MAKILLFCGFLTALLILVTSGAEIEQRNIGIWGSEVQLAERIKRNAEPARKKSLKKGKKKVKGKRSKKKKQANEKKLKRNRKQRKNKGRKSNAKHQGKGKKGAAKRRTQTEKKSAKGKRKSKKIKKKARQVRRQRKNNNRAKNKRTLKGSKQTCTVSDSCVLKAEMFMRTLNDKVKNYEKQRARITRQNNTAQRKKGKKGEFAKVNSQLVSLG